MSYFHTAGIVLLTYAATRVADITWGLPVSPMWVYGCFALIGAMAVFTAAFEAVHKDWKP